jgi:DNA-binding response OmpR family regulator
VSTILIIDDEKNLLRLYENEFRLDGYSVITANSGSEALQKLKSSAVNLVILDIRMPELDGVETLKHIMELPSKPPIILNSAYTSYKDNFLTWAAAAYVVKSSDLTELKAKAKELLELQAQNY